jgi:hypothetical protein
MNHSLRELQILLENMCAACAYVTDLWNWDLWRDWHKSVTDQLTWEVGSDISDSVPLYYIVTLQDKFSFVDIYGNCKLLLKIKRRTFIFLIVFKAQNSLLNSLYLYVIFSDITTMPTKHYITDSEKLRKPKQNSLSVAPNALDKER